MTMNAFTGFLAQSAKIAKSTGVLVLVGLTLGLTFGATAHAISPVTDCFKTALSDSEVFVALKRANNYPQSGQNAANVEVYAVQLCRATQTALAPIACYKTAMTDPEILSGIKRKFFFPTSEQDSDKVEMTVISLCASAPY
jgi:hypothetical protein